MHWDAAKRVMNIPIDFHSGASRIALMAQVVPPAEPGGSWSLGINQGMLVLAASGQTPGPQTPPFVLDRVNLSAIYDPAKRIVQIPQGDLRGASGGVAFSGAIDFSDADPRIRVGMAGSRMSVPAFKRLWPVVVAPDLRRWMETHFISGTVEKAEIAANLTLPEMLPHGPPVPDDGLSIDVSVRGAMLTPVEGLPAAKNVDISTRVQGRRVWVNFGQSQIDLPSGGRLNAGAGTFEVADTSVKPSLARARVEIAGSVENSAELMGMEPLRSAASLPFDAGASRGAVNARMTIELPLMKSPPKSAVRYAVEADVSGFSADRFVRGYKAESGTLKVTATQLALHIQGDLKIAGTQTAVDYRQAADDPDADVRMQATLDDAARTRLGLDFEGKLSGPTSVKMSGRMRLSDREGRMSVEADLTQAKIADLLPGWTKNAGRAAKANFTVLDRTQGARIEDLVLDGGGVNVRGWLQFSPAGDIQQASLSPYALTDGDKASLRVDRTAEGALKMTLRGDVYDGRGLVKSAMAGSKPEPQNKSRDIELDIKLGAITGFHGEALRNFDMKLSRRTGLIRAFTLSGGLGSNAKISGEMRNRGGSQRVMYVETTDAGALFRFTDFYPKMYGGTLSIGMEPPTSDNAPQDGLLNIQDFVVRGEDSGGVAFSRMRVEFTRSLGRFAIRDGVVWGPSIGATIDGTLDFARDDVRLRGTFVPAYGINNMFSRLPIVGMFLGGGANEGLLGITYQVVGTPRAPVLQVNPMSAIAPGFLRKLFEFRGADDSSAYRDPTR
ncbi:MAG: hypothetical protein J0H62_04625, partial [Rhizobiales bacterium]|nr:hypothetical protein [Hyphomicrobiales bacterium]